MKNYPLSSFLKLSQHALATTFAMFCLLFAWNAQATAPRVTPQLFGEVKVADIVSYQLSQQNATSKADGELGIELLNEAFKAAGKSPVIDVLPSKQLATYALFNNDVVGLIGSPRDVPANQKNQYRITVFLLVSTAGNEEPVALITSNTPRGNGLSQALNEGLQKIIKNGKYLEIQEKYHGKGQIPGDYFSRLKKHK